MVNDREDKQDTRSDTNTLNHLNNLKMSNYKIEAMTIEAKTKKDAVKKYQEQHFVTFMCECEKSFNTLYKLAKKTN